MDNKFNDNQIKQTGILIVDDQPANVKLLERLLAGKGYSQVHGLTDPTLVESYLQQNEVDLILLDIRMPVMDGFAVINMLRNHKEWTELPVIVLTAQTDIETRHRALETGANDFLTKPYDHLEVLLRVSNALKMRLMFKELKSFNSVLAQKVKERTQELEETIIEIIRRLGHAAEYRDNETGLHVIRMSLYSAEIARQMGFPEDKIDLLQKAAPMHDLGKIGIPDNILLKPGKLDDQEFFTMKSHPEIGAEILKDSPHALMQLAEKIALQHHEKWDGSGYPGGLKGEEINLEVRIVSLADVFDALTTERPYKKAWSVEEALELIQRESGKHFDPQVVEHFLACLPRLLEIKDQYAEAPLQEERVNQD